MGNRILVAALESFAPRVAAGRAAPFTQVVLTAPDIDAGVFRQRAGRILGSARHFTIYARLSARYPGRGSKNGRILRSRAAFGTHCAN
jgi:esterase/lipase superfamily enzyme